MNPTPLIPTALLVLLLPISGLSKPLRITDEEKVALRQKLTTGTDEPPIAVLYGKVAPRKSATVVVPIEEKRCYRFGVVARKPGTEISLALFQGSKEVARDRLSGTRPSVVWCATQPGDITVEVAMFGGSGLFGLALFPESAPQSAQVLEIGGDQDDFIANRIRQLYRQFGDERAPVSRLLKGKLAQGASTVFSMKTGGCLTVIGVGGPGVDDLDITLNPKDGANLVRDNSSNGFPIVKTPDCPLPEGVYEVRVTMAKGNGHFGLQVFSTK